MFPPKDTVGYTVWHSNELICRWCTIDLSIFFFKSRICHLGEMRNVLREMQACLILANAFTTSKGQAASSGWLEIS